jgi:PKHD-type hydroxylase
MLVLIEDVLPPEDVARLAQDLAQAPWRDGKLTAGATARAVKANEQAAGDDGRVQGLTRFVADALWRHPAFMLAARPKRLSRLLFSRYTAGMAYGPHTDDALMGPPGDRLRADVAFTLFLAAPETYEGGALEIDTPGGAQSIKLPAGACVIYPAGTIHQVTPVTAGARLACVGWAQSEVRDPAKREVLFDLAQARAKLSGERADLLLLDKTASALLRMWAEP